MDLFLGAAFDLAFAFGVAEAARGAFRIVLSLEKRIYDFSDIWPNMKLS